jgi:hypothetical protein
MITYALAKQVSILMGIMGGYNWISNNCQNFCEKMLEKIDLEYITRRESWPVTIRDAIDRLLTRAVMTHAILPPINVLLLWYGFGKNTEVKLNVRRQSELLIQRTRIPLLVILMVFVWFEVDIEGQLLICHCRTTPRRLISYIMLIIPQVCLELLRGQQKHLQRVILYLLRPRRIPTFRGLPERECVS